MQEAVLTIVEGINVTLMIDQAGEAPYRGALSPAEPAQGMSSRILKHVAEQLEAQVR